MKQTYQAIKQKLNTNRNCVIGFFDGVHKGHRKLIRKASSPLSALDLITFDEKPGITGKLTSTAQKLELLDSLVDGEITCYSFDILKDLEPETFIEEFLKPKNISTIYVGSDFRFGKDRKGDVSLLRKYFKVKEVKFKEDDEDEKISSKTLRQSLIEGDVELFKKHTKRNYELEGEVTEGNKFGAQLGFSTANLSTDNLLPKDGVYVSRTIVKGKAYDSITAVSTAPTLTRKKKSRLESHILDYDEVIYGETIKVQLCKNLREIIKFPTEKALIIQIKLDVKNARKYHAKNKFKEL